MAVVEFFSPPDGEFVKNPSLEWLGGLILGSGEDFWSAGAGQASLKRTQDVVVTQLLMTFVPGIGFYLEFIDQNSQYFVSLGTDTSSETTTVYVGGDPLVIPNSLVVARDQALAAVSEFCATGDRSPKVNWKRRSDVKRRHNT